MKRREALLWSTALAMPARAQRSQRIAYLGMRLGPNEFEQSFVGGLRELGYVEGRNLVIDYRWADNDVARHRTYAAELLALKPDLVVIADRGTSSVSGLNPTIPIVVPMLGDPIRSGFTRSLSRPDGQVTGMSALATELSAKRLELFKEALPGLRRVGSLYNALPVAPIGVAVTRDTAPALDIEVIDMRMQLPDGIAAGFAEAVRQGVQGIVLISDTATISYRKPICEAALKHRLPAIFPNHTYIRAGGLMSYGPNLEAAFHRAASLVDRLLKGARIADVPIEQPTTFRLVLNRSVARAIGITFPQSLMLRADEVLE
jgi:putative tryptophan/tyrosine transport system substrate-binding protein